MADAPRPVKPYELFALFLSVFALLLLGIRAALPLDPESRRIIDTADIVLCVFFFFDFVGNLARSNNRLKYLYTWGWLDLIASIPAVDALRFGRLGRIVRVLRVIRVAKASRMLALMLTSRRRESAVWASVFISIVVVFSASIAVLELEREAGGNIANAEDALWWSITTITTVGYGDRYPVTTEGRLVAVALMVVGVGLFGMLSGAAASWFMQTPVEAVPAQAYEGREPNPGSRG
jgi:voltage-gated potassium channel